MTSFPISPVFNGLAPLASARDAFLAQALSPTYLDPVAAADPFQSRFCAADSGDDGGDGGAAAASISPHFDEILDTFETRAETGELIFPRLEARPGGFEVRPTVLTQETVASLDRLRSRIGREMRRLLPDGHEEMTDDELSSNEIPLSDVWRWTPFRAPENNLLVVNYAHEKSVFIDAEKDRTRIHTAVGPYTPHLTGEWTAQKLRVALSRYHIHMPLDGLRLFLDLPRPIDYTEQVRLLLATLGVAHFKTGRQIQEDSFASEKWRFAGRNDGRFRIEIKLWVLRDPHPPSVMNVSFTPWNGTPRPLEGEALRLWNWVRDGLAI